VDQQRIYLDNAATTWPKPEAVYQAVDHYQRAIGVSAGRGGYSDAIRAVDIVDQARSLLRRLFVAPPDSLLVFAFNGTDALNLCLHGFLRSPCHVITSDIEHNSVLRPLRALADRVGIEVSYAASNEQGVVSVDAIRRLLRSDTRLVALSHASNVTGVIQPVEAIGELLRSRRIRFLVDAAQSAGHLPINLQQLPIDLLATSGHKGLLGPLGTGVVYFAPHLEQEVASFRQGGTGSSSDRDVQPESGSSKFEAGNLPAPSIAGLAAALEYVIDNAETIRQHELKLTASMLDRLVRLSKVRVLGSVEAPERVGVVSFVVSGVDCHEVAAMLETTRHIQVRAGLMCAPRMHTALGAPEGSVRASLGPFNSQTDVDALCDALELL
jgi:cysteine desulfurase family protein